MPDFSVSVAIRGDDQMSGNLRRLTGNVDRFGRRASRSFGMASRAAGMFRSVLGGVLGANVIMRGFAAINMGIGETVRGFADMDQALTSAGAKFQLTSMGVEKAASSMQALNDSAREVGATTEFTATQAAQGLEFLAMAGFSTEQAIAALPKMVDLATAANTDLARASDIASDALGAFGLASDDAATQAANLTRINDVFAKTTAGANVDMENLFETFKMGAPIMTTAGQSLESFASMAAAMGNAGIKGSLAGTTLKNTISRLVAPAGKAKAELQKLNVTVADGEGNMRDVALILEDFADATKDMGNAQRTAAISTIFGMRAVSGISTILDKGIPTLRGFRDGLDDAQGSSKSMADEMRKSLTNRLKTLKSSLLEVGMRVIEAFQDKFPGALDSAIAAIRSFDVQPIIDGIRTVVDIVKSAWDWFKRWKVVILALVAAYAILKTALALTAIFDMFIAVVTGATTVTKLWAASQWGLNVAMYANPITLIIALIIALIAVVVLVIVYWDDLAAAWTETMTEIFNGTNETFNAVVDFLAGIAAPIYNVINDISNWFGEMWHGVMTWTSTAVKFVLNALRSLKSSLGFDVSDIPTDAKVDKWLGVDKEFEPSAGVTKDDMVGAYQLMGKGMAAALGADTAKKGREPAEAPNQSRGEMEQRSYDLNAEIDIFAPEGYTAKARSGPEVNGRKAPGVVRAQAGKNRGAA